MMVGKTAPTPKSRFSKFYLNLKNQREKISFTEKKKKEVKKI